MTLDLDAILAAARAGKEAASPDWWCERLCRDVLQGTAAMLDERAAIIAAHIASASPDIIIALVERLQAAETENAALIARRDELLALVRRISQETPLSDEARGWTSQRAAMIAEIGTLRAEVSEWTAAGQQIVDLFDPLPSRVGYPGFAAMIAKAARRAHLDVRAERDRLRAVLATHVDHTNPQCPIGAALTGSERRAVMAKDKLFVDDDCDRNVYRITWYLAEEGDHGATIGDGDRYTEADLAKAPGSDRPHIVACLTAEKTDGVKRDNRGYYWESRREATTALRMINLAIKNDGGAPWPEWAIKAKAERWTPPKGWKPV